MFNKIFNDIEKLLGDGHRRTTIIIVLCAIALVAHMIAYYLGL